MHFCDTVSQCVPAYDKYICFTKGLSVLESVNHHGTNASSGFCWWLTKGWGRHVFPGLWSMFWLYITALTLFVDSKDTASRKLCHFSRKLGLNRPTHIYLKNGRSNWNHAGDAKGFICNVEFCILSDAELVLLLLMERAVCFHVACSVFLYQHFSFLLHIIASYVQFAVV